MNCSTSVQTALSINFTNLKSQTWDVTGRLNSHKCHFLSHAPSQTFVFAGHELIKNWIIGVGKQLIDFNDDDDTAAVTCKTLTPAHSIKILATGDCVYWSEAHWHNIWHSCHNDDSERRQKGKQIVFDIFLHMWSNIKTFAIYLIFRLGTDVSNISITWL